MLQRLEGPQADEKEVPGQVAPLVTSFLMPTSNWLVIVVFSVEAISSTRDYATVKMIAFRYMHI